ncbi:TonB-dependent receptor domain-containing protein [Chitinophaga sp. MM2321]|uniref:TonB-dependent receptor domain-containing protein n=1 Tax=Chitinophaga sp. MM2321 TaxID=3137178 RepID=UPI0032D578B4
MSGLKIEKAIAATSGSVLTKALSEKKRPFLLSKKCIYFIGVLLVITSALSAQNAGVGGIVSDQFTHLPMSYASVSIYNTSDTSLVNGTITDSKGHFQLNRLKAGHFYLKIQFVGYQTKMVPFLNLSEGEKVDLGVLFVNPDQRMLDEIKVVGKVAESYNKIDKQVYRANQFEAAKGGSAMDVLKNMPSVSVTGEGEISMRGSTGFLVLINGKPVLTDAQLVLSQIPANAIENIELITAPSAKYDPDGKSGIINIVTKKGVNEGLSFVVNVQKGLPSTTDHNNLEKPIRFGGDVMVNYKNDKWDISAGANYTRNDVAGFREGDAFTKNYNDTRDYITRFPSTGERSFDKHDYAGRMSLDFTPDSNNVFSLGFFSGRRFQSRLADIHYKNSATYLDAAEPFRETEYFNSNLQIKEGNFTLGNLDYTHIFLNKSSLTAVVVYERANLYGNTRNRNLTSDTPGADTLQYVFNPYKRPINGYRFKLDYAMSVGRGILESGYQFRYDTQEGKFDYQVTPLPAFEDPARFSGSMSAKSQINAVYSQYSAKAGQLEYIGGLRYEYATRTVDLSYDPVPHKLNLSNLFPTASLLYTLNNGWKTKAGYSRRIQRTTHHELNPIPEREHSETLEQGDPNLLPELVSLVELGVIKNLKSGSFFVTAYYQDIKNAIQRVNSIYADTILNRVYTNAERARLTGLELGTNLQPLKWWNLYIGGNVYHYKINGNLNILGEKFNISNTAWAYSINANTNFKLSSTWSIQGNLNYLSDRPTAQGENSMFLTPGTSVKKTFMKGKMSVMLQWQNMDMGFMGSGRQRITTSGPGFYTTTNYIYETDIFMVNLSFSLNRLTSKLKLPKSELGDKEF